MVGDGTCDSECYVEDCEYDLQDCGCAPNCKYEMINDTVCQKACQVYQCDFDTPDCSSYQTQQTRIRQGSNKNYSSAYAYSEYECSVVNGCDLSLRRNDVCSFSCYSDACNYDMGDCDTCVPELSNCEECFLNLCLFCWPGKLQFYDNCVDVCPRTYKPHHSFTDLCIPEDDFTTPSAPLRVFVKSGKRLGGKEDGSKDFPFTHLAAAISSVHFAYAEILLLKGEHSIESFDKLKYPELARAKAELLIQDYSKFKKLTIRTLFCTDTDHALCAVEPAVVYVRSTSLRFLLHLERSELAFEDVVIDGRHSLMTNSKNCNDPHCEYCPYFTTDPKTSKTLDDKGQQVDTANWGSQCATLKDLVYFDMHHTSLTMTVSSP
jgi:hypothetical protein